MHLRLIYIYFFVLLFNFKLNLVRRVSLLWKIPIVPSKCHTAKSTVRAGVTVVFAATAPVVEVKVVVFIIVVTVIAAQHCGDRQRTNRFPGDAISHFQEPCIYKTTHTLHTVTILFQFSKLRSPARKNGHLHQAYSIIHLIHTYDYDMTL